MARETGLEPATSTVTGWYSNQLSYSPTFYLAVQNVIQNALFASLKTSYNLKKHKNNHFVNFKAVIC